MELIFVTLIIVGGFCFITHLNHQHFLKLEVLLKARDLIEAKSYQTPKTEVIPVLGQEELRDAIQDKPADQIRQMFKPQMFNSPPPLDGTGNY